MDLFPPSNEEWETSTLLGPLEGANLSHLTNNVRITTDIETPEARLCPGEITGACAIKIVINLA
jgi:hypothetical protein